MASSRKVAGTTNARTRATQRIIKVAPVTRAVRIAMAASATAFVLAGAGAAYAGNCAESPNASSHCIGTTAAAAQATVADLTRVAGGTLPSSVTGASSAKPTLAPGITITNTADITVTRPDNAVGLSFSANAPVTLNNSGHLDITSTDAIADGIFVSGTDVVVKNSGQVDATGDEFAAGIEAQGSNSAKVTNSGVITASAAPGDPVYDPYG